MSARAQSHITETRSRQIFEAAITHYGDMLFRTYSERDYGVHGVVELFLNGEPTGRFAHVQLKGTMLGIEKLKRSDEVSCSGISKSNLSYCRQKNIPVMLVYLSTKDEVFYYIGLNLFIGARLRKLLIGKRVRSGFRSRTIPMISAGLWTESTATTTTKSVE